jgi:hypothetical protein
VCVSDELLDRLGDLYQKYAFQMTFEAFLEMVLARLEERYGPSRGRRTGRLGVALTDMRDTADSEEREPDAVEKASTLLRHV